MVRGEMQTPLFKRSMRLRRGVERVFADAKGKRGLTRLHLRGLRGAEEEFLLGAAIANLVLLARPTQDRPGTVARPRCRNASSAWPGSAVAGSSNPTTRRSSDAG
jgi:hypothetical protein